MTGARRLAATVILAPLFGAPAVADTLHLYSYDPADAATRQASGPLTFSFHKGLLRNTLVNLRSTEAPATADLRRSDEGALGHGGLARLVGPVTPERDLRDLYEVQRNEEGEALIAAFCPGAGRAWMAVGPVKFNRDLTVAVIGAPARGGPPKVCRTLRFTFHGEWQLPPGHTIDARSLERRRFPG